MTMHMIRVREDSSRTKQFFNLPSLVLKDRYLGGSAFCNFYRLEVSEQALGGIPLGVGIVVEDKPSELSCLTSSGCITAIHKLVIY